MILNRIYGSSNNLLEQVEVLGADAHVVSALRHDDDDEAGTTAAQDENENAAQEDEDRDRDGDTYSPHHGVGGNDIRPSVAAMSDFDLMSFMDRFEETTQPQ